MNSKIKKIMLLTTGFAGALIATSIAGITLTSCRVQVQDPNNQNNNNSNNNNNNSSNQTTNPKDELTYNPNANYYTTQIIFDSEGNITKASANQLTTKDGLIFADHAMTTLIGIMPGFEQSQITIPSSVKAITGYQAAVVYDTSSNKIVDPSFNNKQGLILATNQEIKNLGSVGAFQKLGDFSVQRIHPQDNPTTMVTAPIMTTPNVGLKTLTSIQFANNSQLQTIGPKAFAGCSNLTSVSLPDTCNTIGAQAFQNCTNLQTINLKGVQYIGDAAFNNAFIASNNAIAVANPVSLNLSSAQYLGVGAFDSLEWRATITIKTSYNQSEYSFSTHVLPGTKDSEENPSGNQTITTTVKTTPHISKISTVTFGSKLNTLSQYAFNGANHLTSADLSNCTSLATIGNNAFSDATSLSSVKFSNTIGNIGDNAFSGGNLTGSLSFNTNGDLNIGAEAFNNQNLTSIDFSAVKGNIVIGAAAFLTEKPTMTLTTLTLPTEPTNNEQNTSYVAIKTNAFGNCEGLKLNWGTDTNPSIPNNIAYIGINAFSEATLSALNTLSYTNPLQVTSALNNFGNGQFAGVTSSDTTYFGPMLMSNNGSIKSVDLSSSNIKALNYADMGNEIDNPAGGDNDPIKIKNGTFDNAYNLTDITLPASCSQFGINYSYDSGAFANCISLQNLNFKNFTLDTKNADGSAITPGFEQISQATWIQVANIMNALAYFGQQQINAIAPSDVNNNTISTVDQMDKIGYNVVANSKTSDSDQTKGSSWTAWFCNSSTPMIQKGLAEWAGPRVNFNYPINAYPAGSYGYSVTNSTTGGETEETQRAGDAPTPITVNYPAGLGTSVSANFKNGASNPSLTVTMANGDSGQTLGFGSDNANGPLLNGSGSTADNNVIFNTSVANADNIQSGSAITLTANSTRPQSVWYTVSASGTIGGRGDTFKGQVTQNNYDLTEDENKNIFSISPNKIPGGNNNGEGGIGTKGGSGATNTGSNQTDPSNQAYTTSIGGKVSFGNDNKGGIPINSPNIGDLVTNTTNDIVSYESGDNSNKITLNQNYLPLGITSNVKDAYFNHNGIIWHYHNGFEACTNDGIYIEGYVNAYIGGQIQSQGNGANSLSIGAWTNSSNKINYNGSNLTNGVYNNGSGLTSVGTISGKSVYDTHIMYGIDSSSLESTNNNTICYPYIALFGSGVNSSNGLYSKDNAPNDINVKLILVNPN